MNVTTQDKNVIITLTEGEAERLLTLCAKLNARKATYCLNAASPNEEVQCEEVHASANGWGISVLTGQLYEALKPNFEVRGVTAGGAR